MTFNTYIGGVMVDSAASLTCVTIVGSPVVNGTVNIVAFPGESCTFSATYNILGQIIAQTGLLQNIAGDAVVTGVIVTGGAFGPFPSTGPTASQRTQTVTSLQNSFNSVTPSVLGTNGLGLNGTGTTNGNGVTFTPSGLSFNRSPINSANPWDREYGAAFAPQGYFARHGPSRHRNNGFNFSLNPQAIVANAKRKETQEGEKLGLYRSGLKDGATQTRSRWVPSLSGRYVDFDDDQTGADRDGSLWYVTSALGYRFTENTTAGVFTRYREGEVDSVALASSLDSELWGGGVYLATTAAGGVRFIGSALYEQGENDITISGATGDFDNDTITLEASLDKRITRGRTWIEPQFKFLYHKSDNDDFTDSAGNFVLGETTVLGRVSFGPRIGTTLGGNGRATLKPFAKINGIWDYEHDDTITTATGALLKTGETALNLGGGVDIVLVNGLSMRVAGDWFTYDTELEGWSISGGIGGSFDAFGLAGVAPGFVSLDLSSNGEDASATARIRIPLGGGN